MSNMDWVDKRDEEIATERAAGYFDIVEGKQQFVLLSHCAPLAQVWTGTKYRPAVDGDKNVSIKGVCWVLQDGKVKEAKLPYTVVKEIRALQTNPEWEFTLPFPHTFTLTAKGAKSKEVEYSINASPKKVAIPTEILAELKTKPTPDELVERIKGRDTTQKNVPNTAEEAGGYDADVDPNPDDIPF